MKNLSQTLSIWKILYKFNFYCLKLLDRVKIVPNFYHSTQTYDINYLHSILFNNLLTFQNSSTDFKLDTAHRK